MKYDVIVVGAGFAGSTAARIFAEQGKKVLIIEKRRHIGGNCYDFKDDNGVTIHKYGPHIFNTVDKNVWDFVNRFTDFNCYQHKVLSYVNSRLVPIPINRDTICDLFGVNISINEVEGFLANEARNSKFNDPAQNFRDVVVSQVGETLYELMFKKYTIKQWERDPEELSPDVAKRIPVRTNRDDRYFSSKYQGMPIKGYTPVFDKMLEHENIAVMLGVDYFNAKDDIAADFTVYTGELDRFFDYKYGKLEYRSIEFKYRTVEKEKFQPAAVVNYPNDYDYTRITEYKHFLDEKTEKSTICFEYPKKEGIPYYVVLTEENTAKRKQYIEEVKKLEEQGKYAFVGRLAEYKYYNMDQVVASTMKKLAAVN